MSDTRTWLMRSYGLSNEDVNNILMRITAEVQAALSETYDHPPEPARLQPITITFTAEVDTTAIVDAIRNAGALT